MSYWDSVINLGNGQPRNKSTAYAAQYPIYEQQTPQYPNPPAWTLINQGYRDNEIVYACIGARAEAISSAPLHVFQNKGKTPERIGEHPLRELMINPCEGVTENDFWNIVQVYLGSAGFSAWEIESTRMGDPLHLWPMRPDWCSFYRGDGRPTRAIRYQPYGLPPADIPIDKVLLFRYFDPIYPLLKALSPSGVAMKTTEVDNNTSTFLKNFYQHGAVIAGLLKTAQTIQDAEAENIRRRWRNQHGGVENWADIAVIGSGVEYQPIAMTFKDMAFGEVDSRSETRICQAFKVPPIMISAKVGVDRSTYNNYEQSRKAWYEGWVTSEWKFLSGQVWTQLLPKYEEKWKKFSVSFYLSDVEALRENRDSVWKRSSEAYRNGEITRDESRKEKGFDPVDDAEVFYKGSPAAGEETEPAPELPAQLPPGSQGSEPANQEPGEQPEKPKQQEQPGSEAEQKLEEKQFRAFAQKRLKEGKAGDIAAFKFRYLTGEKRAALLAEYAPVEQPIDAAAVIAELKRSNELLAQALHG